VSQLGVYERAGKRAVDVVGALVLGAVLSPAMAVAALLVWLDDRGPVLFVQDRVGKHDTRFPCFKIRTMSVNADRDLASADAHFLEITRVGRWLRRTNLDEVPQLLNVLRGEMSLVGPRPGLPSQSVLHEERARSGADRLPPGLTGWAQVNGYDHMPEADKARYDAEYAASVTLRTDLRILVRTVTFLFRPPPVY
jgi:O-antigen biosynthesis protein WbqP